MLKLKRYYKLIIFLLCLIIGLGFSIVNLNIEKPEEISNNYNVNNEVEEEEELPLETKENPIIKQEEVILEEKKPEVNTNNKNEDNIKSTTPSGGDVVENYVSLSINCNTINSNLKDLKEGLRDYVPSDGIILSKDKIEFTEGETVYDILNRITRNNRIKITSIYNSLYNSQYIVSINNISEKSCGESSGWKYKVNGNEPNYGISEYKVSNGDIIEFLYTCKYGDV